MADRIRWAVQIETDDRRAVRGLHAAGACETVLHNTHTNVFSVFVFVQLYTGMAELTEYTMQVYNNCAHHARMKCTIQC